MSFDPIGHLCSGSFFLKSIKCFIEHRAYARSVGSPKEIGHMFGKGGSPSILFAIKENALILSCE